MPNMKTLAIVLAIMAILGGTIGLPQMINKTKASSLDNDKTQIGASNSEYYQATSTLAVYPDDISTAENNQVHNIYNGLLALHKDEQYVKEHYKVIDVDTLVSNRFLSSVYNKDKRFVTNTEYLDVVLTEDDFKNEIPDWILAVTQAETIDLRLYKEGDWDKIPLNVKYIKQTTNGLLATGTNPKTNQNVLEYRAGMIPATIESLDKTIQDLLVINYFNETSLSGYTDIANWDMRRK